MDNMMYNLRDTYMANFGYQGSAMPAQFYSSKEVFSGSGKPVEEYYNTAASDSLLQGRQKIQKLILTPCCSI
jgi:hypothetical protein